MNRGIYDDDPEHMIEILNRNRHLKVIGVVAGIVLALGTLFLASFAMYSEDPAQRALEASRK